MDTNLKTNLKTDILNEVTKAQLGDYMITELKKYEPKHDNLHEFTFFIKPEVTAKGLNVNVDVLLELIFTSFDKFEVSIDGAYVLGGSYLDKYEIMDKHYGVINSISKNGVDEFTRSTLEKYQELYGNGAEPTKDKVMGGHEFLSNYSMFNPQSLDVMWESIDSKRLGSGTYSEIVKVDGKEICLVNGFHPNQLLHYTQNDRSIVVMMISTNKSWDDLRSNMIGVTNPMDANIGSIRRTILDNNEQTYLLNKVNRAYNAVHLSAGPIEALVEIIRFGSKYLENQVLNVKNTAIGNKMLDSDLTLEKIEWLMTNPKVVYNGQTESFYDLVEGINLDETIKIMMNCKKN